MLSVFKICNLMTIQTRFNIMTRIPWRDLFPSKISLVIFVVYILLFVNQGILVTASQQSDNKYDYNIVTVVLFTEVLKLIISSALYCREFNIMTRIPWRDLFPSKISLVIFVVYILLFVNQGILVTASQQSDNKYDYNIVTVVLFTEVLKLIISSALYCRENKPSQLFYDITAKRKVLVLYFIPAFLYCLYNNLAFINLSSFDPTTYYLLLQVRVVVTGVLFQVIFGKLLSKKQWISLVILTIGCMLKQVNFNQETEEQTEHSKSQSLGLSINAVFILIQIFCSCFAGVYNEYLLKNEGANVNIFVQNVFMYLDSIICNVILLVLNGSISKAFLYENIAKVFHYKVLIVMLNNAAVGIVTSFFLKTLNSILKTFASALELVLTAIFSLILFGIPVYLNTLLAIATVMYAIYLYSQNPVSNVAKLNLNDVAENQELVKNEEV